MTPLVKTDQQLSPIETKVQPAIELEPSELKRDSELESGKSEVKERVSSGSVRNSRNKARKFSEIS